MNRKWVAPALAVAALAVTVQNILFFTSGPSLPDGDWSDEEEWEDEDDGDDGDEGARTPLTPVSASEALRFMSGFPEPALARNPFLTRLELDSLAGRAPAGEASNDQPRLNGTLISRDRRVAYIDGTPLSEGDVYRGFQIVRIEKDVVALRDDVRDLRLEMTAPAAPGDFDEEGDGSAPEEDDS